MLIEGVASGDYDLSLETKETNNMRPKFTFHKLDAFRAHVSKLCAAEGQALIGQFKCV